RRRPMAATTATVMATGTTVAATRTTVAATDPATATTETLATAAVPARPYLDFPAVSAIRFRQCRLRRGADRRSRSTVPAGCPLATVRSGQCTVEQCAVKSVENLDSWPARWQFCCMADSGLNPTAAALLGLLHDGPMTGGQLMAAAQRRLGPYWSMTRSQVYRELPALADAGFVKM